MTNKKENDVHDWIFPSSEQSADEVPACYSWNVRTSQWVTSMTGIVPPAPRNMKLEERPASWKQPYVSLPISGRTALIAELGITLFRRIQVKYR